MTAWPGTLPQYPLIGLTDQASDAVARTAMDAGPSTRRNRYTAVPRTLTLSMVVTGTQRATLETFFHTTLANGALAFDWTDPMDDATVSMAFTSPPQFTLMIPAVAAVDRKWQVSVSIEIQP